MILDLLYEFLDPRTLLVFASFLLVAWYLFGESHFRLPPGPTAWPLIGSFLYVRRGNKALYMRMMDLYREYGPIARLKIGRSINIVFVFGADMIRKAGVEHNDDFKFRPNNIFMANKIFNGKGVILGNGEQHAALKKLSIVAFRDFGVGKKTLEERIHEEIHCLSDVILEKKGEPHNYLLNFKLAVANIIANIVYGQRFEYDDAQFLKNLRNIDTVFKSLSLFLPENLIPALTYLPGSTLGKVLGCFKELEQYATTKIQEHRDTFDPKEIRDFVDLYLQAETNNDEHINEENMFRMIVDLFNAGTDTTATGLSWAILHLIRNPAVQEKCRAEIMQVAGNSRLINLEDKKSLHYLQATICETMRISAIAPQSVPHFAMKDTTFAGYDIPKGTVIIFHLYSALMDPDAWDHPEEFKPERFLNQNGEFDDKKESFIPFSIGGRSCLGKHLARMELFSFLGNLLQRFKFKSPDGEAPPDPTIVQSGITGQPKPYNVCAVPI